MRPSWEAEKEFQDNVIKVEKWQRRAKYKFGAVVILIFVAAAVSFGFAVAIGTVFSRVGG